MTSFDVVAYIRKRAGGAKTGHAGTLDPAAAGVLPVCVGKATRLVEYMNEMRKLYRAEMLLGQETDTQDGTGRVVSEKPVNVSRDQVEKRSTVLSAFRSRSPMYSAVKVAGKKLYELARRGETVRRKARKIEVYGINIVDIYDNRVLFDIECSRGTYIRTICHDAGREMGCGAHMKFLLRKRVGPFTLENAHTLEELRDIGENSLLSPDEAVKHFDKVILPNNEAGLLINGRSIQLNGYKGSTGLVRVYNEAGLFLAVGEVDRKGRILKPRKIFTGRQMQVIYNCSGECLGPKAVGLGNFDGLHLGHMTLINTLIKEARSEGIRSIVYTFNQHPENVLVKDRSLPLLNSRGKKVELLSGTGLDLLYFDEFDEQYSRIEPEDFVRIYWLTGLRPG